MKPLGRPSEAARLWGWKASDDGVLPPGPLDPLGHLPFALPEFDVFCIAKEELDVVIHGHRLVIAHVQWRVAIPVDGSTEVGFRVHFERCRDDLNSLSIEHRPRASVRAPPMIEYALERRIREPLVRMRAGRRRPFLAPRLSIVVPKKLGWRQHISRT